VREVAVAVARRRVAGGGGVRLGGAQRARRRGRGGKVLVKVELQDGGVGSGRARGDAEAYI
jgi:hypothetical protein